jgi:DNA-binding LacI/PurR family transcriptional regulator
LTRPTIHDVAERAGVSKSLVSLVLRGGPHVSEASRRAVLRAADEVNYRPNAAARSLSSRRSHLVGLMLSDLHNPFFAEVADGIRAAATERNYRMLINTGFLDPEREAEAIDTLLELRTDGLILAAPQVKPPVIREASRSAPLVVVNRAPTPDGPLPSMSTLTTSCCHSANRDGSAA